MHLLLWVLVNVSPVSLHVSVRYTTGTQLSYIAVPSSYCCAFFEPDINSTAAWDNRAAQDLKTEIFIAADARKLQY